LRLCFSAEAGIVLKFREKQSLLFYEKKCKGRNVQFDIEINKKIKNRNGELLFDPHAYCRFKTEPNC